MPQEVEIERFTVKSDEGKEYTIIAYQEYFKDRDTGAEVKGLKRLTTTEELHVHVIDPGTFKIFETGEIVKRI